MSLNPDKRNRRPTWSTLVIGLGLAMSGCGDSTGPATTRLTIQLTDAQGGLDEAWVEITGMYLQGSAGESGERTWLYGDGVTASSAGMIDLLTLTDASVTMVEDFVVPAGVFGQLRIIIGDAVVKTTEGEVYATEGAAHPDGLPVNGTLVCPSCSQTGFKVLMPNGALRLDSEAKILLVDFDVAQSFGHAAGGSRGWVMHPVLRGSDFLASGTISGTVDAASANLAGCGVDMTAFIPMARDGEIEISGHVNGDGSYEISFVPPGTYTLGYADPVETASGSVQFQASATPAAVTVGSGGTATADYTITSCDVGGGAGGSGGGSLTWASLAPPFTGPARHRLSTALSEAENVLFACEIFGDYQTARLWKFDFATNRWVIVNAAGWPTGKYRKCVLDPVDQRMLTYWDGLGWVYAVSTSGGYWIQQGRNTNSDEYYEGAPFFDPAARQLTHFAGYGNGTFKNDLKAFDRVTLTWTDVSQTDPPDGRFGPPRAVDAAGARAFFAGRDRGLTGAADDLWVLDLTSYDWTELIPAGAPNALDRFNSGVAYVPSENALYRFGGTELGSGALNADLVRLDLDASTLEYTIVPTEGPAPGGRDAPELHYDPAGHRLILVGGRDGTGYLSEVWALDLPS